MRNHVVSVGGRWVAVLRMERSVGIWMHVGWRTYAAYGITQWKCHMDVIFAIERLTVSSSRTYPLAYDLFEIKGDRTY